MLFRSIFVEFKKTIRVVFKHNRQETISYYILVSLWTLPATKMVNKVIIYQRKKECHESACNALVEEQPGTPGIFPSLFKVAREKYLFSPAQISGQNDKNFLICPKLWFEDTVLRYDIETRYRDTASRYGIEMRYRVTISRYKFEIQYRDTASRYDIEIRHRDTINPCVLIMMHQTT